MCRMVKDGLLFFLGVGDEGLVTFFKCLDLLIHPCVVDLMHKVQCVGTFFYRLQYNRDLYAIFENAVGLFGSRKNDIELQYLYNETS